MQKSLLMMLAAQVPMIEARTGQALFSRLLQPVAAEPESWGKVRQAFAPKATVENQKKLLRTRSYSMSGWLNGQDTYNGYSSRFVKCSQLNRSGMAQVLVFLDQHQNTINDGAFGLEKSPSRTWVEMPSDRHSQGCNLSHADGHVTRMKWMWPKKAAVMEFWKASANDRDLQDLRRLQEGVPE